MDEVKGIREFKTHLSDILRSVRQDGASFTVTHRGQAVARLTPMGSEVVLGPIDKPFSDVATTLAEFDALAEEIARHLSPDQTMSAVEMVRDQRRD